MQIGFAGLGKMGSAMVARLLETGHHVAVWNRSADKAKGAVDAGATAAPTPAALTDTCDVIMTSLTDAAAIDVVYNGASGLLRGDARGKLFIEMSTVERATEIALAGKVRTAGAAFVECPVGGTVGPARQGTLLGLMGAAPEDAARAQPILEKLCRKIEHVGPVGNGATVKLAVNLPLMVSWQAFGEAFALCRDIGFAPERLVALFADTSGTTNAFKARSAALTAMAAGNDPGAVTFDIASGVKDLRTMLAEAKARGVELPLIERTLAAFAEAEGKGLGASDAAQMTVYWSRR